MIALEHILLYLNR